MVQYMHFSLEWSLLVAVNNAGTLRWWQCNRPAAIEVHTLQSLICEVGIVTLQCNTQNCSIQVLLFTELYTEQFGPDTVGKLSRLTELPGQLQVTGGDVTNSFMPTL